MNLTKAQIEEQIKQTETKLEALLVCLAQEDEPWTPEGGSWYFTTFRNAPHGHSTKNFSRLGLERKTEAATGIALERMISSSLLQAYVYENCGDWIADWNDEDQRKCSLVYCFNKKAWWYVKSLSILEAGTVYMNEKCADKLRDDLNSGRVVTNARMNLVPVN